MSIEAKRKEKKNSVRQLKKLYRYNPTAGM